jgi:hypothetical protein
VISRPFLGRFKNFFGLNDSKFNAKFVSDVFFSLHDTVFESLRFKVTKTIKIGLLMTDFKILPTSTYSLLDWPNVGRF